MSNDHSDAGKEVLSLSDGAALVDNFAIARIFQSPEKICLVRDVLDEIASEERTFVIDGEQLNEALTPENHLIPREVDALFTGLCVTGAAQEDAPAESFIEYSFEVDHTAARNVLDQQLVAARMRETSASPMDSTEVDLVATIPEPVTLTDAEAITYTSSRVRELLLNAQSLVQIANPYFDSEQTVMKDIASLPRRDVTTKILTRETEDPDRYLRETLNTLYEHLEPRTGDNLKVRDLYEIDPDTGYQQLATHAKLVIIDEEFCYIGSANLTYHSLLRNFEFGVLLSGPIAETISTIFDDVFAHARQVDLPLREGKTGHNS